MAQEPGIESENIDSGIVTVNRTRRYIRERQHVLLLKDHVIAWLARLFPD